jgi:hypothetical protein
MRRTPSNLCRFALSQHLLKHLFGGDVDHMIFTELIMALGLQRVGGLSA